jgi:hypothetical protein
MSFFAIGVSSNKALLDRVEDVKAARLSTVGGLGVVTLIDDKEGVFGPALCRGVVLRLSVGESMGDRDGKEVKDLSDGVGVPVVE